MVKVAERIQDADGVQGKEMVYVTERVLIKEIKQRIHMVEKVHTGAKESSVQTLRKTVQGWQTSSVVQKSTDFGRAQRREFKGTSRLTRVLNAMLLLLELPDNYYRGHISHPRAPLLLP